VNPTPAATDLAYQSKGRSGSFKSRRRSGSFRRRYPDHSKKWRKPGRGVRAAHDRLRAQPSQCVQVWENWTSACPVDAASSTAMGRGRRERRRRRVRELMGVGPRAHACLQGRHADRCSSASRAARSRPAPAQRVVGVGPQTRPPDGERAAISWASTGRYSAGVGGR